MLKGIFILLTLVSNLGVIFLEAGKDVYIHCLQTMKPSKRRAAATSSRCTCCPLPTKKSKTSIKKRSVPEQTPNTAKTVSKKQSSGVNRQDPVPGTSQGCLRPAPIQISNDSTDDEGSLPHNEQDNGTDQETHGFQPLHQCDSQGLPTPIHPNLHGNIPAHSHCMPPNPQDVESSSDSEDEFTPNLQGAISNHTQSLLSGNVVQFAEPISTPIVSQIRKSICRDIWKNKFVDMATLLPSSSIQQAPHFTLQMDSNSNLSITPSSRSRKITNIETWTSAFIRFCAVYTVKYPLETPHLMKYTEIVRDIANRRPGLAFLFYDSQFRMLRETITLPWDRIHTEFWLMACTSYQPTQSFRASRQPSRTFSHSQPRTKRFLENTCWNYNKRTQCRNQNCPHPHVCGFCRGSHTAYNCTFSSKDHTAKTYPNPKSSTLNKSK